jgi:hypothetical protein
MKVPEYIISNCIETMTYPLKYPRDGNEISIEIPRYSYENHNEIF